MANKRIAFFLGLLLCQGILNFSYTQTLKADKYNVIKEAGFETDDETWKETTLPPPEEGVAYADRHSLDLTAPQPKHAGVTSAGAGAGKESGQLVEGTAILTQEFVPRIISDFNLDSSLTFWIKWIPYWDGPYEWGITVSSLQRDTLTFKNPGKQDTWTYVNLGNIYELWTARGLPETDSLYKIELWARGDFEYMLGERGKWLGEKVSWDLVCLYSKRPDLDAEILSIDSPDRLEEGYEPITTLKNPGALPISFPVICDISQDGNIIYSDTSQIDNLKPDSSIQITFKPYSGSISSANYTLKCYTSLDGDQNPKNDTLEKTLTTTGISERPIKGFHFRLSTLSSKLLTFSLSSPAPVSISLYDISGRLVDSWQIYAPKGLSSYKRVLNLSDGVYFLRAESSEKAITRKIVIVK